MRVSLLKRFLSLFLVVFLTLNAFAFNVFASKANDEYKQMREFIDSLPYITAEDPILVSSDTGVGGFVTRLYRLALEREPDSAGYSDWCSRLEGGMSDGATVANGFLNSPEFISRGLSNEDYVSILYSIFFDREPDPEGFEYWVSQLNNGQSRDSIISGFINSTEWANTCLSYGILSGGTGTATIIPPISDGITNFVTSLYEECLGREGDESGINDWCLKLASQRATGKDVAFGFFFSSEFASNIEDMDDYDIVGIFYEVFLDRTASYSELTYWVGYLRWGGDISNLFSGFADSQEFFEKCCANGIICGREVGIHDSIITDDFVRFANSKCVASMPLMESATLNPHNYYYLMDARGSVPVPRNTRINLTARDIAALSNFANSHFQSDWTAAQKAVYTLYWINRNVTYATNALNGVVSGMGYAQSIFEARIGQCDRYNGAMVEMLCWLGYEATLVQGQRHKSNQPDVRFQHFWGEITIDNFTYVMETGNYGEDGDWAYFCVQYLPSLKYVKNGVVVG